MKDFFNELWDPRLELARSIKLENALCDIDALLLSQRIIDRLIVIYLLGEMDLFLDSKEFRPITSQKLFSELLDNSAPFECLKELFFKYLGRSHDYKKDCLDLNEGFAAVPYIGGNLFVPRDFSRKTGDEITEKEVILHSFDWKRIIRFFENYQWSIETNNTPERIKKKQTTRNNLTPEILSYIHEKLVISLLALKEEGENINLDDDGISLKGDNLYFGNKLIGAYYTPKIITQFMIKQTLDCHFQDVLKDKFNMNFKDLLEKISKQRLNEEELGILEDFYFNVLKPIKICDNACGSGAFLIEAFNLLHELNLKCLNQIIKHDHLMKEKDTIKELVLNEYSLKRDIITNNLFGVDLQEQSISTSKMLLFLLLISGMDSSKVKLPSIEEIGFNLQAGNTLIGRPYTNLSEKSSLPQEECDNLHAFDWDSNFKEVFHNEAETDMRGFDIIIGNPPYLENKKMKGKHIHKELQKHLYQSAYKLYDYSYLFVERSYYLLKNNGYLSYILPNKICSTDSAIKIRDFLLHLTEMQSLIELSKIKAFEGISTYPVILTVKKTKPNQESDLSIVVDIKELNELNDKTMNNVSLSQKSILDIPGHLFPLSKNISMAERIRKMEGCLTLRDLNGENMAYRLFGFRKYDRIYEKIVQTPEKVTRYLKFIGTKNIQEYKVDESITFTSKGYRFKGCFLPYETEFEKSWQIFEREKLLIKEVSKRLKVAYDPGEYANVTGMYMFIPKFKDKKLSIFYLLGVLNSSLLNFLYHTYYGTTHMAGGYLNFHKTYLLFLPVKIPENIQRKSIEALSKMLFMLKKSSKDLTEKLKIILDCVVFELYFTNVSEAELTTTFYEKIRDLAIMDLDKSNYEELREFSENIVNDPNINGLIKAIMNNKTMKELMNV